MLVESYIEIKKKVHVCEFTLYMNWNETPKVENNILVNKSRCFRIPTDLKLRLPSRNCKRNGISIWSKRNMVNHWNIATTQT